MKGLQDTVLKGRPNTTAANSIIGATAVVASVAGPVAVAAAIGAAGPAALPIVLFFGGVATVVSASAALVVGGGAAIVGGTQAIHRARIRAKTRARDRRRAWQNNRMSAAVMVPQLKGGALVRLQSVATQGNLRIRRATGTLDGHGETENSTFLVEDHGAFDKLRNVESGRYVTVSWKGVSTSDDGSCAESELKLVEDIAQGTVRVRSRRGCGGVAFTAGPEGRLVNADAVGWSERSAQFWIRIVREDDPLASQTRQPPKPQPPLPVPITQLTPDIGHDTPNLRCKHMSLSSDANG
jgi:hypothetical protein